MAGLDPSYNAPKGRVLITGATGFVGRHLMPYLVDQGWTVRAAVRRAGCMLPAAVEHFYISDLATETNWADAVEDVDVVIHLAAQQPTEGMVELGLEQAAKGWKDPDSDMNIHASSYRKANRDGSLKLAAAAKAAGCKQFIFVSTALVHGTIAPLNNPVTPDSPFAPDTPYAQSKAEAEIALMKLLPEVPVEEEPSIDINAAPDPIDTITVGPKPKSRQPMALTILRPPMIYGAAMRTRWKQLLDAIDSPAPLPFGGLTENKIAMVYIGTLVQVLEALCLRYSSYGRAFLVRDDLQPSTAQLCRYLRHLHSRPARLLNVPDWILKSFCAAFAKTTGKHNPYTKLTHSFCVDDSELWECLQRRRPFSLQQGLNCFRKNRPNPKQKLLTR